MADNVARAGTGRAEFHMIGNIVVMKFEPHFVNVTAKEIGAQFMTRTFLYTGVQINYRALFLYPRLLVARSTRKIIGVIRHPLLFMQTKILPDFESDRFLFWSMALPN